MARAAVLLGFVVALSAAPAQAQTARLVGQSIGGHMEWNPATRTTRDSSTLTFGGAENGVTITVDFVTQYEGERALQTTRPRVVDVIVTEHPTGEESPQMTMTVNGEGVPLVPRLHSRRSIVSSISFDDFVRLADAESIVQRAFDVDLVFGTGQLRMLRSVAQRWSGDTAR
jgi:hypothetical protein